MTFKVSSWSAGERTPAGRSAVDPPVLAEIRLSGLATVLLETRVCAPNPSPSQPCSPPCRQPSCPQPRALSGNARRADSRGVATATREAGTAEAGTVEAAGSDRPAAVGQANAVRNLEAEVNAESPAAGPSPDRHPREARREVKDGSPRSVNSRRPASSRR
jgi:hypothetical protein